MEVINNFKKNYINYFLKNIIKFDVVIEIFMIFILRTKFYLTSDLENNVHIFKFINKSFVAKM